MRGLLLAALVLASCSGAATETTQTQNKDFKVDFLFENDGCRIYRFQDGGYSRYYVRCQGGFVGASTFWTRTTTQYVNKMVTTYYYHEGVADALR